MNYTENEIFDKVKKILANVLNMNEEEIKADSKIVQDLGAESLDIVTLLMELEDAFDKKIKDEDAAKLQSVSDVVGFIKDLVKNGA